jgi:hypothetical protein
MATCYWLQLQHGHGARAKAFSLVFECDHPGLVELTDELTLRGVVFGSRLDLISEADGSKLICGRHPLGFGAAGLVAIQPYFKQVREPQA